MNTQLKSAQTTVEWTSKITLWVLIGISLVILVLFLLIGYDRPYEENPSFNDPQLTDALLIWTYFLIAATALTTIIAVIAGFINGSGKSLHTEKGLASKANLIAWGTFIVSVRRTFLLGDLLRRLLVHVCLTLFYKPDGEIEELFEIIRGVIKAVFPVISEPFYVSHD